MVLSSYLPLAETLPAEASAANRSTPIFMAHGTEDPVIDIELGRRSQQRLVELGYPVEWHEYPMPHSVCLQEIEDISRWLQRVLAA